MSAPFRFKEFMIYQDACAMKVGTDGVLLGAWAPIDNVKTVLDIGTGTGLIALMLSQRTSACVDAIEIEGKAYEQAKYNIRASKYSTSIKIKHIALQDYKPVKKYDLIICNPPYFENTSLSKNVDRNTARHNQTLSIQELLTFSEEYLSSDGVISVVLPILQGEKMINKALSEFYCSKVCEVFPTSEKESNRLLMNFRRGEGKMTEKEKLIIEEFGRHKYSNKYKKLTKDFYLNF